MEFGAVQKDVDIGDAKYYIPNSSGITFGDRLSVMMRQFDSSASGTKVQRGSRIQRIGKLGVPMELLNGQNQ